MPGGLRAPALALNLANRQGELVTLLQGWRADDENFFAFFKGLGAQFLANQQAREMAQQRLGEARFIRARVRVPNT